MELNEKQKAILTIAEGIISEKGFEAASIREISKKAEINLAMVSYYFGSKEKLLVAIFLQKASEFKFKIKNIISDENLSTIQKILTLADNYIEKVFNNLNFHKIMLKEIAYLESTEAYDEIIKTKIYNYDIIENVIQEGIKNQEINDSISVDIITATINGTIANHIFNEKYYRTRWNLDPEKSFGDQTKEKIKNQIMFTLKAILTYDK